jgi:GTP cyclohydrolase I
MGTAPQRSHATLGLHHFSPGVRPTHDHGADVDVGDIRLARVAAAYRVFLESLGLDLTDPDLAGTDQRVARTYRELLGGLRPSAEPKLSTFPNTERYAGIVSVTGIPFYSICAHHFLPFFGTAHVGYVPGERLLGLSKMARVVDLYARRPQLQERLTEQVAALLDERIAPAGVIVSVEARHLCMEMRGVSRPGVVTTTTAVRGMLKDERLQQQFFARLSGARTEPSTRET